MIWYIPVYIYHPDYWITVIIMLLTLLQCCIVVLQIKLTVHQNSNNFSLLGQISDFHQNYFTDPIFPRNYQPITLGRLKRNKPIKMRSENMQSAQSAGKRRACAKQLILFPSQIGYEFGTIFQRTSTGIPMQTQSVKKFFPLNLAEIYPRYF